MKGKHKKDLSKIKYFNYGKMDHFLTICLMNKKEGDGVKKKWN